MKGYCYIALILGFFIFYQQNPLYAIIIIVLFIGVYLFFKSRSSGSNRGVFGFFSGKNAQQDNRMDDLITLMMIQQLMNSSSDSSDNRVDNEKRKEHEQQIDKIKQEVLELLEED
ncbi:MAG: hypothetical protein ACFE9S_04265 [Candidatus Hermodarchaeota archaeon]